LAQVLETHDPKTFAEASGHPDWDTTMNEEYLSLMENDILDPKTSAEASGHPDWDTTMNEEYHSIMENDIWDLVPLPKGKKLVRCKWVYRTKYASDGSVEGNKARLIAKGFSQVEGIDYNETFSHVAKMNSICLVLSLLASHKWEVHQMDVKSAFLHGDLQEEIYMEQAPIYV
jgi:hypothetical protein